MTDAHGDLESMRELWRMVLASAFRRRLLVYMAVRIVTTTTAGIGIVLAPGTCWPGVVPVCRRRPGARPFHLTQRA